MIDDSERNELVHVNSELVRHADLIEWHKLTNGHVSVERGPALEETALLRIFDGIEGPVLFA